MCDFYKLSEFNRKNFSKAINELYEITDFNNSQYPGYTNWFYGTNIPRIIEGKGDVIFALDGFMVKGLIVMKNTIYEKKICTLFVDDLYRNQKLGSQLLEQSFEYLGTDKPTITIPEKKIKMFDHFIKVNNWDNTKIITEYYDSELQFN